MLIRELRMVNHADSVISVNPFHVSDYPFIST